MEDKRAGGNGPSNDVSWYSRNPTLLMAAASIPFPYRPGMYVPWNATAEGATQNIQDHAIPGIMTLRWMPTVGYSQTATDPPSVVGKEMFAKVREKFSGSIDADPPDFVIYTMALDSIFAYIAHLKRIYRVLTAYTSENHYIPDVMMNALGFTDAQILDLKNNRMQFFQMINELVYMTRKFNIPAVFDIINRHYWLSDNVYTDAESINSQFYAFVCVDYFQYGLSSTTSGVEVGSLSLQHLNIPNTNVAEYLFGFGRDLINALSGSDDAYIISGYLMRAYEGTPVFTVDELVLEDRLIPRYDPEVLSQIENARATLQTNIGNSSVTITNTVTQDPSTNAIICKPHCAVKSLTKMEQSIGVDQPTISIRSDAPTVADVVIATRLKMGVMNYVASETGYEYDIVCGSEIVTGMTIYAKRKDGVIDSKSFGGSLFISMDALGLLSLPVLTLMQSFDWHPIIPTYAATSSGTIQAALSGDVHNLTMCTNEQLYQINRVCLYSEFNSYGQI